MAVKTFKMTSLLALAAALVSLPSLAQAQDEGDRGSRGGGEVSGDIGGGAERQQREARSEQREARAEQRQARAEARAEAQAAPEQRSNGGNGSAGGGWRARGNEGATDVQVQAQAQAQAAPRWGSQRPVDGERRGRDWSNGGTVNRPAPAWRGATPATPERGVDSAQHDSSRSVRNGTYSDPNRRGSYRDGNRDRSRDEARRTNESRGTWADVRRGRDLDGRDGAHYRDGDRNRDGYRSGDGTHWGSNDRNGYRNDHRRWDRNDWRRHNRYNWSSYRNQHRSIFRIGSYYSPYRNYSYRRLNIGFHLQSLFYSNRYWINDPWQYRLPDAYGPYRWVRYYDDALLVDIYSGEVVDVIHNFFW